MKYAKPEWRDGQPYSTDFEDVYFSANNGVEETEHVFIRHNQLQQRFSQCKNYNFTIAETGFGSGLNFLIAARYWLELSDSESCLYFYSVESTPFSPEDLKRAYLSWPELKPYTDELLKYYQVASYGFHSFELFRGRIKLVLMIGDVQQMLPQMQASVDAWFLDGFAPSLNQQMWSESVYSQITRLSHQGSTFSTYTSVGDVKRGLIAAGFSVKKVSGCGKKRHMLCGEYVEKKSRQTDASQPWYVMPENTAYKKTACVIGAGIAGLSTAWSLVKRGFQVEIIEAGEKPGTQASGNPRAMLMPRLSLQDSADAEFYTSAYFYALRCLLQLDESQTIWQQTGGLQLASSERVKKQIAEYSQDETLAMSVSAEVASRLCGLSVKGRAHYFPQAACLYPSQILQQLIKRMGSAVSIHYNCEVSSISYENKQWHVIKHQGEHITSADCLILASSWQTRAFEPFSHLYLQAARGQLSLLPSNKQSENLHMPVSFGGYILPENSSQHVIGASFELDDCSTELRDDEHLSNIRDVNLWFKGLFNSQDIAGGRASVRAVAPDRIPVVGPAPTAEQYLLDYAELYKGKPAQKYPLANYLPGLFVNTGHGARGFTSAFLCAELLCAYICNEPLPVSNRVRYAVHPARFLIRSLKKKRQ